MAMPSDLSGAREWKRLALWTAWYGFEQVARPLRDAMHAELARPGADAFILRGRFERATDTAMQAAQRKAREIEERFERRFPDVA